MIHPIHFIIQDHLPKLNLKEEPVERIKKKSSFLASTWFEAFLVILMSVSVAVIFMGVALNGT